MQTTNDVFWVNAINTLKYWRKKHPDHAPQLYKFQKTFEHDYLLYIKLINQYNQKKSHSALDKAEQLLKNSTASFEKIKKLELIATLSK